jgi:cytochrome c-type biogenesis protein CcmH/NrfG
LKSTKHIQFLSSAIIRISLIAVLTVFAGNLTLTAQQATTYEEAIKLADKYYAENKLMDAKAYYQMALKYKSDDTYARRKMTEVVDKMKSFLSKEDEYYDIIDLADVLYDQMALDKALEQYQKALNVIPGDEYAQEQMAKIRQIQSDQQEKLASFDKAMEEGNKALAENKFDEAISAYNTARSIFPDKPFPSEQIELARKMKDDYQKKQVLFDQEKEEAERYLLIKNYAVALQHFENAYEIFPENEKVNARIAEIRPKAENQRKYNELVDAADELYISKDFMGAMAKYRQAADLWPENSYPKDMMGKIDVQLGLQRKDLDKNYQKSIRKADSLLAAEEFTAAQGAYKLALNLKPDETYPKTKLAEIDAHFEAQQKAFEANYQQMVAKADSLFDAKQYMPAKEQYEFALTIKPEDPYPQQKLKDIDQELALIAEHEKKDKEYNDLIAEGDQLFNDGHYDLAVSKYKQAQAIKSFDDYPGKRIEEIQLLLLNAAKQKELDEKYGNQIMLASRLFREDKLEEAKMSYANALDLKPDELLPKQQIHKIDSIIDRRARQAEIDAIYQTHLNKADSLFNLQEYENAITAYEEALSVKPEGTEAQERLAKTKSLKTEHDRQIALQKTYDDAIKSGNMLFNTKSYELAKVEFEKAKMARPAESYPVEKIKEIDVILEQLAAERQQRFDEAILKADEYFNQGNFRDALIEYKTAGSIKPEEKYPQAKIAECEKTIEAEMKVIREQYNLVIAEADNLYNSKVYDKAIQSYKKAHEMMPDETYALDMIGKITRYLEENAITDIVKTPVTIHSEEEQKFNFEPIPIKVRKSNYVLIRARNLSNRPFKLIFTYGSDNGKNGGFSVQIPKDDEMNDFIIRVGNQYKWFSDDNNWLSIYPQNGDIEIKVVRITTSN